MEPIFRVNPQLDIPLYRQLVDAIENAVKKGRLVSGQKLPTVQELSETLAIARGTIKRAYDELERRGILEKVQGRGTFVCYQPASSASRKEQAMAAIDGLLSQLEGMGLSAAEINIFLNLKLRERAEQAANVKVALVECNPETLNQVVEQLRHLEGVDLYAHLLESIEQYPYKLGEDFDLAVTTSNHAEYLHRILPGGKKIIRVALRLSPRCMAEIIRLRPGARVGVWGYSSRFAQLMYTTCQTYAEDVILSQPPQSDFQDVEAYLADKDVLLVPRSFEKYFAAQVVEAIRRFPGTLIPCYYEMDEGSQMYLESKIKKLMDAKSL